MQITVVDNIEWIENDIVDVEYDAASTTVIPASMCSKEDLYDLLEFAFKGGCRNFLINLHCVWYHKKDKIPALKFQQQGGVIVYRMLLQIFEKYQHELKVVFFSPIINQQARTTASEEYLVNKYPENYVLQFFKILEIPFINWNNILESFSDEKYKGKIFNAASENLLSGWSLNEKDKINNNNSTIACIDDQIEEWETTFKEIFLKPENLKLFKYDRTQIEKTGFNTNKINLLNTKTSINYEEDIYLCDFYLEENHDTDVWMNVYELQGKSGYKMFRKIKDKNEAIPVVMHTSSNKIRYFDFFLKNGVNAWLNKDIRLNTANNQKKYNYIAFKNTIELHTDKQSVELNILLRRFWEEIKKTENINSETWWFSNKDDVQRKQHGIKKCNRSEKIYIVNILKESFLAIGSLLQREALLNAELKNKEVSFIASSICINLYKIIESLEIIDPNDNHENIYSLYLIYLTKTRDAAAHYFSSTKFSTLDGIIYLHYFLDILNSDASDFRALFNPSVKHICCSIHNGIFNLFYLYIIFFNSTVRPLNSVIDEQIKFRIERLFKEAGTIALTDDMNKEVLKRQRYVIDKIFDNVNGKFNPKGYSELVLYSTNNKYKIKYKDPQIA